jgi:hypothetical protein
MEEPMPKTLDNLHTELEAVFNYNWFRLYPPTPEELDAAKKLAS